MNVTIIDTEKSGWILFETNDYYDNGNDHREIRDRKDNVTLDVIKFENEDCIELYIGGHSILLSDATSNPLILIVDAVNGATPSDLDNLRDKIFDLLPPDFIS